jgi:hypothetical protein
LQRRKRIMATTHKKSLALKDLRELGRRLEEAGLTLVEAAKTTMSAAAKDTRATMVAAAEDALLDAEMRLRKVRLQMRKPAPPPHRKARQRVPVQPPIHA